jgi:HlyD family secretion protein
LKRK